MLFTITDKQIQPKFDLIGVAAIIASLGFDALTANVQVSTSTDREAVQSAQQHQSLPMRRRLTVVAVGHLGSLATVYPQETTQHRPGWSVALCTAGCRCVLRVAAVMGCVLDGCAVGRARRMH